MVRKLGGLIANIWRRAFPPAVVKEALEACDQLFRNAPALAPVAGPHQALRDFLKDVEHSEEVLTDADNIEGAVIRMAIVAISTELATGRWHIYRGTLSLPGATLDLFLRQLLVQATQKGHMSALDAKSWLDDLKDDIASGG